MCARVPLRDHKDDAKQLFGMSAEEVLCDGHEPTADSQLRATATTDGEAAPFVFLL